MSKTTTLPKLINFTSLTTPEAEQLLNSPQKMEPSAMVIQNILGYSRALSIKKSTSLGKLDVILN